MREGGKALHIKKLERFEDSSIHSLLRMNPSKRVMTDFQKIRLKTINSRQVGFGHKLSFTKLIFFDKSKVLEKKEFNVWQRNSKEPKLICHSSLLSPTLVSLKLYKPWL